MALSSTGQHERAIAHAEKTIAMDPDSAPAYSNLARNLLSANRPDDALLTISRYDLALGRIGFVGRYGALYPIYVRGLAYLAARQPAPAEGEFQRIVEHPHITLVDPMSGLARLQLARA